MDDGANLTRLAGQLEKCPRYTGGHKQFKDFRSTMERFLEGLELCFPGSYQRTHVKIVRQLNRYVGYIRSSTGEETSTKVVPWCESEIDRICAAHLAAYTAAGHDPAAYTGLGFRDGAGSEVPCLALYWLAEMQSHWAVLDAQQAQQLRNFLWQLAWTPDQALHEVRSLLRECPPGVFTEDQIALAYVDGIADKLLYDTVKHQLLTSTAYKVGTRTLQGMYQLTHQIYSNGGVSKEERTDKEYRELLQRNGRKQANVVAATAEESELDSLRAVVWQQQRDIEKLRSVVAAATLKDGGGGASTSNGRTRNPDGAQTDSVREQVHAAVLQQEEQRPANHSGEELWNGAIFGAVAPSGVSAVTTFPMVLADPCRAASGDLEECSQPAVLATRDPLPAGFSQQPAAPLPSQGSRPATTHLGSKAPPLVEPPNAAAPATVTPVISITLDLDGPGGWQWLQVPVINSLQLQLAAGPAGLPTFSAVSGEAAASRRAWAAGAAPASRIVYNPAGVLTEEDLARMPEAEARAYTARYMEELSGHIQHLPEEHFAMRVGDLQLTTSLNMLDSGSALCLTAQQVLDQHGIRYCLATVGAITIYGHTGQLMRVDLPVALILAPGTPYEFTQYVDMYVVSNEVAQGMFTVLLSKSVVDSCGGALVSFPQPTLYYKPFLLANNERRLQTAILPTTSRRAVVANGLVAPLVIQPVLMAITEEAVGSSAAAGAAEGEAGTAAADEEELDYDDEELAELDAKQAGESAGGVAGMGYAAVAGTAAADVVLAAQEDVAMEPAEDGAAAADAAATRWHSQQVSDSPRSPPR
ncbi:hypothetical protein GPECTOR_272g705 [Gonium pectorale]|uniref:Uncharacterized protein n=1 Tax=Gonium pectorale TaxID=33097 RepID=A0A150FXR1_GONPE|nr:hypothetical protein GPECTOR_272g705 [Gonium pectorale]|eukprot:KXZ41820.1 hypothetical protein GPECTOR_272g705 [Gonium pectorale]